MLWSTAAGEAVAWQSARQFGTLSGVRDGARVHRLSASCIFMEGGGAVSASDGSYRCSIQGDRSSASGGAVNRAAEPDRWRGRPALPDSADASHQVGPVAKTGSLYFEKTLARGGEAREVLKATFASVELRNCCAELRMRVGSPWASSALLRSGFAAKRSASADRRLHGQPRRGGGMPFLNRPVCLQAGLGRLIHAT